MSLKDAGEEQIELANELKDMNKGKIPIEKRSLLNNTELLLSKREKNLNNFKIKIFSTKNPAPEPEPTVFDTPELTKDRAKKSQPKLHRNFNIYTDK